jgi:hypothetical protein
MVAAALSVHLGQFLQPHLRLMMRSSSAQLIAFELYHPLYVGTQLLWVRQETRD